MSRNIGSTICQFCDGPIVLDEAARPITREEAGAYFDTREGYGYANGLFANATCKTCEAKYLAWVDLRACVGYNRYGNWGAQDAPFFDLSYRDSFNDEPGEKDLPNWKIAVAALTPEQCQRLEAFCGAITRREPWPRCEKTGRKIYSCYGCRCEEHRR